MWPSRPQDPKAGDSPSGEWLANSLAGVQVDESFRQLVQRYGATIEQYFRSRRCTLQEAQDLTQETFLNAFRGLHTFRNEAGLKAWLLGVALNVLRNELRRRVAIKRAALEVSLDGPQNESLEAVIPSSDEPVLDVLLQKEQREALVRELRSFPPQMRRCMFLRTLRDYKYKEIAGLLQISVQTVKSHLFQGRERLREALEKERVP